MSVRVCRHPLHPRPCLWVMIEGGRPDGYHVMRWGYIKMLVCPSDPTQWYGLTGMDDVATPDEITLVMAEVASDPVGQGWLNQFAPEDTTNATS